MSDMGGSSGARRRRGNPRPCRDRNRHQNSHAQSRSVRTPDGRTQGDQSRSVGSLDGKSRGGTRSSSIGITQIWAIEIVSRGALCRFERDPAGLWFHHIGQHVHLPGGFVHHADLSLATQIEAEFTGLERLPIARIVARHPDAAGLAGAGLEHPATILLLYSRYNAGPVARIELGNPSVDGLGSYALIQQSDALAIVPDDCRAASGN